MSVAIYGGSFDPIHLGHLDVVERAARDFDRLVVAVSANPAKKHLLDLETRLRLAAASTAHLSNVACRSHDGLTVDLAAAEGADVLLRVVGKELGAERVMAAANDHLGFKTVFITPNPTLAPISSTTVRALVATGRAQEAAALVPPCVLEALLAIRDVPSSLSWRRTKPRWRGTTTQPENDWRC